MLGGSFVICRTHWESVYNNFDFSGCVCVCVWNNCFWGNFVSPLYWRDVMYYKSHILMLSTYKLCNGRAVSIWRSGHCKLARESSHCTVLVGTSQGPFLLDVAWKSPSSVTPESLSGKCGLMKFFLFCSTGLTWNFPTMDCSKCHW